MRKFIYTLSLCISGISILCAQNPTPFACAGSDGFGYYISSATENNGASILTYSNSRLSKIVTSTGVRSDVCSDLGRSLNGLAFNPHDNFLYGVTRYDGNSGTPASGKSGTLYRIGANCQRVVVPVFGPIIKFATNEKSVIDAAGGNIGSGTFDLDNNYYVNTSFTNSGSTGFTNKIQKIRITSTGASVVSTQTMTCASCTGELRITDVIFDEASNSLIGSNFINKRLYKINASTGVLTPIASGTTGLNSAVLGLYKNRDGLIRAITANGNIYAVNAMTGAFTLLANSSTIISRNADAASGCYAPPMISGHLFYDTNRLRDGIVNGTGTDVAGTTKMYANLIDSDFTSPTVGQIVKSSEILSDGTYQFLGLFSGLYVVQISDTRGVIGSAPPAQNLPPKFDWSGDNIGAGAGSDGSPDGQLAMQISSGADISEVNFGIDPKPVVVPVDFVSFEATLSVQGVLLNWKTENEINNSHFIIERSEKGGNYNSLGEVLAGENYEFLDRTAEDQVNYRLKQVDHNGSFIFSKSISVNVTNGLNIRIFPSNTSTYLNINIDGATLDKRKLIGNLYSNMGRLVRSQSLTGNNNQMDVQDLNIGIYYLSIITENGYLLHNEKIVKQQ